MNARAHETVSHDAVTVSDRAPLSGPVHGLRTKVSYASAPGDLLQLGFVAQLCLAAADIEQALQLACHFSPLWSRRPFQYQRAGVDAQVRASDLEGSSADNTFDAVGAALTWSRLVERLSNGAASPRAVDAPPYHRPRLLHLLTCPIHDSANELTVRFTRQDIERTNPQFDPPLVRLLATHGEQLLAKLRQTESMRARARSALVRLTLRLRAGSSAVRVDALARELGLGVRTLHRRLRIEGTSFRELLAEHKLERSMSQLSCGSTSAKQVAFELGFADPAAFHRAFKRWTGHTVGQYREINAEDNRTRTG